MENNNDADNPLMDTILTPLFNRPNASIVHPEVGNNRWELKSDNIRLVERAQFVWLRLFPFALKGKTLSWLERQPAASISTWDDLSQKFFAQFFLMEKYNQMVNDITNFTQSEGESMCEAWNQFKDLMRRCPQYNLTAGSQIRMVLNGAAGGTIKTLRENETLELIERMAANENQALSSKPKRGILKLEGNDVVMAENNLLSQQVANLTSRPDKMQFSSVQAQAAAVVCEYCKEDHESNECPTLLADDPPQRVHVNGVWYDKRPSPQNVPRTQNFPSGNNNFQRRVQGTGLDFKSNNYLQPPPVQPKEPSELEKLVGQMAQHSNAFMEETQANTRNTQASIRNLENQIGQIAKQMAERTPGTFPSNTVTNPKDDCMAITTRSGKVVAAPTKPTINAEATGKGKEVEEEVVIPSDVETPVQKGEEEEPQIIVA
ncbi:uncharacterized protein LOC133317550 [Gastrolobium bilobum]|uniref:uncharacterized protein LOC133317550 n=1 Tax=Gastrolobium bilobum TaxID=150636 RepID=UPI002AB2002F|nr:uncharacterized protein LOC133317550 [Gastrolobium bilobum]